MLYRLLKDPRFALPAALQTATVLAVLAITCPKALALLAGCVSPIAAVLVTR